MRRLRRFRRRLGGSLLLAATALALGPPAAGGGGPIDAPDETGPWAVGRLTFDGTDATRDRTLPVDVWYPVDPEDASGPPAVYDFFLFQSESDTALDAPPVSARGPFPLLIFSHGFAGIRFQSFFLTEALASHGFIVAAPDHVGNTTLDLLVPGATPFEPSDRPLDVSFVISRMLARSRRPGDAFHGRVDPSRIGVTGHSFGGFTTLAMAAGLESVAPDPRVDAILPISPLSTPFAAEALDRIQVPTLVLGGTADTIVPLDPQNVRVFEGASARPRYRVDVEKAGHNSFTDICGLGELPLADLPPALRGFLQENVDQGCAPELIPIEEAHRLTRLYAVSFFRRYVAGDLRYRRFLTEGRVARRGLAVDFFAVDGGGAAGLRAPRPR